MQGLRRAPWCSRAPGRLTHRLGNSLRQAQNAAPSTIRQINLTCKAAKAADLVNVDSLVNQLKGSIQAITPGAMKHPVSQAARPDVGIKLDTDDSVLLVLIPGSDTAPDAMQVLAQAVSTQAFASQHTWVASVAGLDMQNAVSVLERLAEHSSDSSVPGKPAHQPPALSPASAAIDLFEAAIQAAVEQVEFPCHRAPSGRYQNVVVLLAGDAGPLFSDAAYKRAGALVLLHSAWSGNQAGTQHGGWSTYGRPMMVVASTREVADQQSMPARDHADLARSLAAFIVLVPKAFGPGDDPEMQAATQYLETQVQLSLSRMQPFALGMHGTDLLSAWNLGLQLDTPGARGSASATGPHLVVGSNGASLSRPVPLMANVGMMGSAVGGSLSTSPSLQAALWDSSPASHSVPVVLSGVVDQAEEELARVQVAVAEAAVAAGWLPEWALSKLRVVVNVQSTQAGLLFCRASVRPCKGGDMEIQIQACLHWPCLDELPPVQEGLPAPPVSRNPTYWAKMKGAVGVAAELRHHLGLAPLPVETYRKGVNVDARTFNQMALNWALDHIPEELRTRYEQEGVQLQCGPDIKMWAPFTWLNLRMQYELQPSSDTSRRVVQASSPMIDSGLAVGHGAACETMPEDPEVRGVWAVMYLKVMSRAQAVDWILSGSHKQAALTDSGMPICWGGTTPAGVEVGPAAPAIPPANAIQN